ncbi:LysM peptidoglycan-binding domain-containing protein [Ilumatobacter nonamiensis]|uniref:LysM peptidoglycan-binding domain-containing protein n=1 Tax=Ilumatobacter nonamiensis TaxID=467093 RepID=UPI000347C73D|nr:LysM peptidoglycan-binding domain-containing protein [Ilumatobacter nonamiensis]
MNELDAFANLRPDDEPFDAETDARIRAALGRRASQSDHNLGAIPGEIAHGPVRTDQPAPVDVQSHRRLAVLGAAAAVIAGLVGFMAIRDTASTPVEPGPADVPPSGPDVDADVDADSAPPETNRSPETTLPPADPVFEGLDDPTLVGLAESASNAADWNLSALVGQTGPTEPFTAEVSGGIGSGRVSFELATIAPTGSCPEAGWEQQFWNGEASGIPTDQGMLFVDETADPARRTTTLVSNESIVTVRSVQVPFADLPDAPAFIDTATAISAETPFILNGGERPRFYEVRCGDLLTHIASRFDSPVDEFVELNALSDEHAIQAGMVLEVPPDPTERSPDPTDPDVSATHAVVPIVPGEVMVANANTYGGLAGRLTERLSTAGFGVADPVNSTLLHLDDSVIYLRNEATCLGIQLSYATGIETREPMPDDLPIESPVPAETPDALIVLGDDIATKVADDSIDIDIGAAGTLTIVDATDDDSLVDTQLATLNAAGIDIAAVLESNRPTTETMLNPIGDTIPWTCGIADLLGIDGFDTWTPNMIDEELPGETNAVLVIGG